MNQFKLSQSVQWSTQEIQKTGRIVAVIPAFADPRPYLEIAASQHSAEQVRDPGWPRHHESYVVLVERSGARRGSIKPKLYWPRVSALSASAIRQKDPQETSEAGREPAGWDQNRFRHEG